MNPAQWVLLAIQKGWSATRGLAEFRSAGGHLATQTWHRLFAEIRQSIASIAETLGQSVGRVPVADEIKIWETTSAKGYIQQVEVLARDKATGEIISIPFSLTGRTLRSRNAAIKEALSVYGDEQAKRYDQQILGAVYTGTYEARPRAV